MNRDLLIVVVILGIVLAALEIYLVKKKKKNRWIFPVIIWIFSLVIAISHSLTLVLFPSLLQVIMIVCFYIEDNFYKTKNRDADKIKIKDL